jgi:hypothetical protein
VVYVPTHTMTGHIVLDMDVIATDYDSLADRLACVTDYVDVNAFVASIGCTSDSIVATIPVAGYPASVARSAYRKLYVANELASSYSVIADTTTVGVAGERKRRVTGSKPEATVIRGILFLPPASGVKPQALSVLLDITGRKVLDLRPGANDVSRLSPGVYFVREQSVVSSQHSGLSAPAIRKVVLTK